MLFFSWAFLSGHCCRFICIYRGCVATKTGSEECVTIEDEAAGQWTGLVTLGPVNQTVTQWTILLSFDSAVDWVESVMGEVSGAGVTWSLASKDWDGDLSPGDSMEVRFIVGYSTSRVRGFYI